MLAAVQDGGHRLLQKSHFVGKDELSHELIISSPAYKFRGCQRQRNRMRCGKM